MMIIKEGSMNKRVEVQIENMGRNARIAVRQSFYKLGKELVLTASKGMLNEPKRGRLYKYKGRNIRASAPGQYPANRSGTLRRSLDFRVAGSKRMFFGASAGYAEFVHEGTRRMKPRPYLTKANAQVRKTFPKKIHYEFQKTVNKI